MIQQEITFPTDSPINTEKLSGQNLKLWQYLSTGGKIHCLHPKKQELGIGYLNSRISDLANKFGVQLKKEYIKVSETTVVEYSLK